MHTTGLQTVHMFKITPTCFGAEAASSWSLKYKRVQALMNISGKYNAKYYCI
jgi:hypothetical protein